MESVSAWALQLGHACLWGSVGIAAVGVVCRILPRLPAGVRAWLWWLACAKLLAWPLVRRADHPGGSARLLPHC